MNNPLIFTDPSGYRPDLIFEEELRISAGQDFGGGGGGSWNPFGWMNQWYGSTGISWRSDPFGGWTYNSTLGTYENRATGETIHPITDYQRYKEVLEPYLYKYADDEANNNLE